MGTEDIDLKRQKIDHLKHQDDNIDMVEMQSYAQVAVKGVEETMSDQYWETIHAVANQALLDVLPDNDDVLTNAES
jgi:archaellin